MTEIIPKLFIGTVSDIPAVVNNENWAVVNLAHTYHYTLHEWRLRDGTDRTTNKCYIVHRGPKLLSVNWIDGEAKYFDYKGEGTQVFTRIFNFIKEFHGPMNVLIACNKGESRAPSVAMAYLAKRTHYLSIPKIDPPEGMVYPFLGLKDEDLERPPYGIAREKFDKLYPNYFPGQGITEFLIDHWHEIE